MLDQDFFSLNIILAVGRTAFVGTWVTVELFGTPGSFDNSIFQANALERCWTEPRMSCCSNCDFQRLLPMVDLWRIASCAEVLC